MLVSAVIPTHNRATMVADAVASALAQTHTELEVIVVDDGSTDDTAALLSQRFGARIRLLRTINQGVAAARNHGVAAAQAEWIAFLDSDDTWHPTKLAEQLIHLRQQPALRITQTQEIWMRHGKRVNPHRHHRKLAGDIFVPSLHLCLVSPSAVLLRRDLFLASGGFDEGLAACEDYDLWLRLARRERFGLLDKPLVTRRAGHADQLSQRFWGMDRFRIAALSRLLVDDLSALQRDAAGAVLAEKCRILEDGSRRRGRHDEADRYAQIAAWARSIALAQGNAA